jgi:segregation and condensation protein B
MSSRELAAAMRSVSPGEIDAAIAELNSTYERDQSPYSVVGTPQGYRLELRGEFRRVRDKYFGRIREARLTTPALEVLAVIAYNQPVTAEGINQIRGKPSGAVLATLVRRRLVRPDRQEQGSANYVTTDRFLRVFDLESPAALPRSEDLETA